MANSQAHAKGSAPNIVSPRFVGMISLPVFGKSACAELKDEGQGCASPLLACHTLDIPEMIGGALLPVQRKRR
jgi:hypothetical protein